MMKFSLCAALVCLPGIVLAVDKGMTRDEVIEELGKPSIEQNNRQNIRMVYPKGFVELKDGKVANFTPALGNPAAAGGAKTELPDKIKVIKKGGSKIDQEKLLVNGQITVVDFYADWCGPCKALAPSLEAFVEGEKGVFLRKVNIQDWNTPICKQYAINSVPNLRVYGPDGKMLGKPSSSLGYVKQLVAEAQKAAAPAAAP